MDEAARTDPAGTYAARAARSAELARRLDRRCVVLGVARILVALAVIAWVLESAWSVPHFAAAAAAFVALSLVQGRFVSQRDAERRLCDVNARELAALQGGEPFGPAFEAPPGADHRYAEDLEIFSDWGLYRHVNRAVTPMGRRAMADWLLAPATADEVEGRQAAAVELASQVDHRQALLCAGLAAPRRQGAATVALEGLVRLPAAVCFGLPSLTVATGVLSSYRPVLLTPFLILVALQTALFAFYGRRLGRWFREAQGAGAALQSFAAMLASIEAFDAKAPRLRRIQQALRTEGVRASGAIARLASILEWMDVRSAPMLHGPLNMLLLWDLNGARALSRWQRRFGPCTVVWFRALGEWEAICSLASLTFGHPDWTFPTIGTDGLHCEDLGHPLIPKTERVPADVHIPPGAIIVVTGPNMAGKSTFLRSIGVGLVLAQAGAPVPARSLRFSPAALITSMRISDSLDRKMSLFYAELQRLRQILDAVEAGEPVFFLVDEMLKGTNTLDRQAGAIALVRQLHRAGVPGIVATHDLALARLADSSSGGIVNFHFDGTVEGDRLIFDYRLREGACARFNALCLMRAIGIHIDDAEHASLLDAPAGAGESDHQHLT